MNEFAFLGADEYYDTTAIEFVTRRLREQWVRHHASFLIFPQLGRNPQSIKREAIENSRVTEEEGDLWDISNFETEWQK